MLVSSNRSKSVGIMVSRKKEGFPFHNEKHFRRLCVKGKQLGLKVFVFSPDRIDWQQELITGYMYNHDNLRWKAQKFQWPSLVYDRYFVAGKKQFALYRQSLNKLTQTKNVRLLNHSLGNKWEIYRHLSKVPSLSSYLPKTTLLDDTSWKQLLQQNKAIFLKPNFGSQGKGTIYMRNLPNGACLIRARDWHNNMLQHTIADRAELSRQVQRLTAHRMYLVQPFLMLSTTSGEAFDIRSLVQKNGHGHWQVTGLAVRQGKSGSHTSNLHGGGRALETKPFLAKEFGGKRATELLAEIHKLSVEIPVILEKSFGRLAELGVDFGVDRHAQLYILEVNSKPGRTAFSQLSNKKQRYESVYNPLFYARFLLEGIR